MKTLLILLLAAALVLPALGKHPLDLACVCADLATLQSIAAGLG